MENENQNEIVKQLRGIKIGITLIYFALLIIALVMGLG